MLQNDICDCPFEVGTDNCTLLHASILCSSPQKLAFTCRHCTHASLSPTECFWNAPRHNTQQQGLTDPKKNLVDYYILWGKVWFLWEFPPLNAAQENPPKCITWAKRVNEYDPFTIIFWIPLDVSTKHVWGCPAFPFLQAKLFLCQGGGSQLQHEVSRAKACWGWRCSPAWWRSMIYCSFCFLSASVGRRSAHFSSQLINQSNFYEWCKLKCCRGCRELIKPADNGRAWEDGYWLQLWWCFCLFAIILPLIPHVSLIFATTR